MEKDVNTQNFAARQLERNYGSSGSLVCRQCTTKNKVTDSKTWTCYKCTKVKNVVEFSTCQAYSLTSNEKMQAELKTCNNCWKKEKQKKKCTKCLVEKGLNNYNFENRERKSKYGAPDALICIQCNEANTEKTKTLTKKCTQCHLEKEFNTLHFAQRQLQRNNRSAGELICLQCTSENADNSTKTIKKCTQCHVEKN